jgi:hypothetical protein
MVENEMSFRKLNRRMTPFWGKGIRLEKLKYAQQHTSFESRFDLSQVQRGPSLHIQARFL